MAPLRCYKCQQMNHIASGCTGPRRCLLCAGPHDKSECPGSGGSKHLCANCGGPHSASARECPIMAGARAVEKLRATGLSYADAAKKVKQTPAVAALAGSNSSMHAVVNKTPQMNPNCVSPVEKHSYQTSCYPYTGSPDLANLMHSSVAAEVHSSQGSYYLETSAKSLPLSDTSQRGLTPTSAFQPSQHAG